MQEETEME